MSRLHGFTLLELLIVLIIVGSLVGVSLPDFENTVARRQATQTIKTLIQTLEFARIAAISNGTSVTLCKSADGESCNGNWIDGVLVFTDQNRNRKIDSEDKLVRYTSFHYANGDLHWRAFQNKQYLQLSPQGFTHSQNGNFTYCPENDSLETRQQIIINRLGRIRIARDTDGDGAKEDSQGKPIRC